MNKIRFLLLALVPFLSHCGGAPETFHCNDADITARNDGFAVKVEAISQGPSSSTYYFTVCENRDHKGAVISVYGGDDETEINQIFGAHMSLRQARAASPGLIDISEPGTIFEVELPSDNTRFVLYEADVINATFVLGATYEMVRGDLF